MSTSSFALCRRSAGLVLGVATWLSVPSIAAAEQDDSPEAELAWEQDRLPQLRVRDDGPLAASMELEMHASVDDEAVELVGPAATLDRAMPALVLSATPTSGLRVHAGVGAGVAGITMMGCSERRACAELQGDRPSTSAALWSSLKADLETRGVRWSPAVALDALTGHGMAGIVQLGFLLDG
jgi:hypothetical protein